MRPKLVTGVILVLALGACGSTSNQATKVSTAALLAGSADAAAEAGTARMKGTVSIDQGGKKLSIPVEGVTDFESGAAELTMDMSSLGLGIQGSIEARIVDQAMYMKFGDLFGSRSAPPALAGKAWIKMDLGELAGSSASSTSNPGSLLESLRGAGSVREVGTSVIDGVKTTHYSARIDVRAAMSKIENDRLRKSAEEGLRQMGNEFPIEVWIDGDGLTRRFSLHVDTKGSSIDETIEFSDYGADVTIVAPPEADTADFAQFMGAATGSFATSA